MSQLSVMVGSHTRCSASELDRLHAPTLPLHPLSVLGTLRYACRPSSLATALKRPWPSKPTMADYTELASAVCLDPFACLLVVYPKDIALAMWIADPPAALLPVIAKYDSEFSLSSRLAAGLGSVSDSMVGSLLSLPHSVLSADACAQESAALAAKAASQIAPPILDYDVFVAWQMHQLQIWASGQSALGPLPPPPPPRSPPAVSDLGNLPLPSDGGLLNTLFEQPHTPTARDPLQSIMRPPGAAALTDRLHAYFSPDHMTATATATLPNPDVDLGDSASMVGSNVSALPLCPPVFDRAAYIASTFLPPLLLPDEAVARRAAVFDEAVRRSWVYDGKANEPTPPAEMMESTLARYHVAGEFDAASDPSGTFDDIVDLKQASGQALVAGDVHALLQAADQFLDMERILADWLCSQGQHHTARVLKQVFKCLKQEIQ